MHDDHDFFRIRFPMGPTRGDHLLEPRAMPHRGRLNVLTQLLSFDLRLLVRKVCASWRRLNVIAE